MPKSVNIDFSAISSGKKDEALAPIVPEVTVFNGEAMLIKVPQAKAAIDAYYFQAIEIRDGALSIKVADAKTREQASEMGVRIKNLVKDIDLAVENVTGEAKKFVSEITNSAKKIKIELEKGKHYLADELLKDKQRQDLERRKQEEAMRKADEARRKALEKEAKRLHIEPPPIVETPALPKDTKEQRQTRTDVGVSFARGKWTYELLDINQVPREYLLPKENGALINQKIKQGLRDKVDEKTGKTIPAIPGLKIIYKEDIAFR
jgi:hypothetical protein